ncbi:MAG: LPS export ABC transporter permease LptG [Pseudomonadota bacterium]
MSFVRSLRDINLTLNLYMMKLYVINFLIMLLCLLTIIYLFDVVELLRRASKFDDVPFVFILQMGLLKLPEVGQQVFPFVVLFSAMFSFWQLSKRYELVVMRSAGFSVWQFMGPVLLAVVLIGILQVTVINPLSAHLIKRFESLESFYLDKQSNLVSLSKQGLWLRQDYEDGLAILHADSIKMPEWQLQNVIVFFFNSDVTLKRRVDAARGELEKGEWRFLDAVSNQNGELQERSDFISMATDLTIDDIEESFSDPMTISFWALPSFMRTVEQAGFNATPLKVHFQKLLSTPLLFLAMVFLAASVSLRPPRQQGTFFLILFGIAMGFGIFFLSNFLQALGASGQIPILIAAWFPASIAFILGLSVILRVEDG